MSWNAIGYAALCVVAPVAWGLVVYWLSGAIERRVLRSNGGKARRPGEPEREIPLEYHI
jgi:hypothetical protein